MTSGFLDWWLGKRAAWVVLWNSMAVGLASSSLLDLSLRFIDTCFAVLPFKLFLPVVFFRAVLDLHDYKNIQKLVRMGILI